MGAANTSETSVNFYILHYTTTQKTAIFLRENLKSHLVDIQLVKKFSCSYIIHYRIPETRPFDPRLDRLNVVYIFMLS
jgi:hypothetical protein